MMKCIYFPKDKLNAAMLWKPWKPLLGTSRHLQKSEKWRSPLGPACCKATAMRWWSFFLCSWRAFLFIYPSRHKSTTEAPGNRPELTFHFVLVLISQPNMHGFTVAHIWFMAVSLSRMSIKQEIRFWKGAKGNKIILTRQTLGRPPPPVLERWSWIYGFWLGSQLHMPTSVIPRYGNSACVFSSPSEAWVFVVTQCNTNIIYRLLPWLPWDSGHSILLLPDWPSEFTHLKPIWHLKPSWDHACNETTDSATLVKSQICGCVCVV